MKAMFLSDLLIAKKYLLQQTLISVIVGVVISVMLENLYVVPPVLGVMIPFSLTFTLLAYDERDNWQQFRLSLPLSRTDIVLGRYASLAIIALAGLLVGLLTMALLIVAATVLPHVSQLAILIVDFSWQAVVLTSAAAAGIILCMLAVIMPLVSRFGMTKAIRFVPLLAVVGVMIAFNFGGGSAAPEFLIRLAAWIQTPEGTLGMAGIIVAATCVLYALSGALSVVLYQKREL